MQCKEGLVYPRHSGLFCRGNNYPQFHLVPSRKFLATQRRVCMCAHHPVFPSHMELAGNVAEIPMLTPLRGTLWF